MSELRIVCTPSYRDMSTVVVDVSAEDAVREFMSSFDAFDIFGEEFYEDDEVTPLEEKIFASLDDLADWLQDNRDYTLTWSTVS